MELQGVEGPADLGEGGGGVGDGGGPGGAHLGEGGGVPRVPGCGPVVPGVARDVGQPGLLPRHGPVSLVEGAHVQLGPVLRPPETRDPGPRRTVDWRPLVHSVRVFLHVFCQIGLLNRDKL